MFYILQLHLLLRKPQLHLLLQLILKNLNHMDIILHLMLIQMLFLKLLRV
jgi:hypothetical protein